MARRPGKRRLDFYQTLCITVMSLRPVMHRADLVPALKSKRVLALVGRSDMSVPRMNAVAPVMVMYWSVSFIHEHLPPL